MVFIATLGAAVMAQPPTGVFTTVQAESGRALYTRNCSACHGAQFEGSGDAPALAGGTFLLKWRSKMVSELFGLILESMPPTNPGSLGEAAALIGAVASRTAATASMVLGAGSTAGQGKGGAGLPTRGVTAAGEVANYVPVTPEMLKNPPATARSVKSRATT